MEKSITIPKIRIVEMPDYFYAEYETKRLRIIRIPELVTCCFGLRTRVQNVAHAMEETVWAPFYRPVPKTEANPFGRERIKFDTMEAARDYAVTELTNRQLYPKYHEIPEQQVKV
jgi:hypothetical protein